MTRLQRIERELVLTIADAFLAFPDEVYSLRLSEAKKRIFELAAKLRAEPEWTEIVTGMLKK